MGTSTDAYLFYGISFVDEELEVNGEFLSPWDADEALQDKLTEHFGFSESEPKLPDDYWGNKNRDEALYKSWRPLHDEWQKQRDEATPNVEIKTHCSDAVTLPLLTTGETFHSASRGYPREINLQELVKFDTKEMDDRIKQACEIMGWEYTQPSWQIASYWG